MTPSRFDRAVQSGRFRRYADERLAFGEKPAPIRHRSKMELYEMAVKIEPGIAKTPYEKWTAEYLAYIIEMHERQMDGDG